ncbi:DUF3718 domain-containing protein [Pleionea sp. CnH1-48]|uniref:DUF3718 domain-containing protein n=1 Tax=Pleionea sp. CnH1-48 TaxID=2954494 RepID=UPI00209700B5|nr:DUF3718 domain-containing protein [Pleionea sp. CnH1-48]MCO7226441.1 DUF3718 domain-containing protein [Pleionea sp. CnH1-48]
MRKKVLFLATCFTFSMLATPAKANDDLIRLATSLCDYAKADDRTSMRRKLKTSGMNLRSLYPAISCGSKGSLLRTATHNNAFEAAKFITSRIGKKNLKKPENDGKNILEWTQSLVSSGDAGKQPFVDLFQSKM